VFAALLGDSEKGHWTIQNVGVDGLPPGEGVLLPCSFWLAHVLCLQGRREEATALFERLLSLRNDLGLISEEYDLRLGRLVGNFPQALTHLTLVDTALTLSGASCREPAEEPTDRTT
jgi:GH15 family glucan-1,4-alpha-glucosidase